VLCESRRGPRCAPHVPANEAISRLFQICVAISARLARQWYCRVLNTGYSGGDLTNATPALARGRPPLWPCRAVLCGQTPRRRKSTGGVRHSGRAEGSLERSDPSVREGHPTRSVIRRRVERPRRRLRTNGTLRRRAEGVRKRARARSEKPDDLAELQSVQGNL